MSEDCGLKVSITAQEANATIELKSTKIQCDSSQIYHALFFTVFKEIDSVKFKIFDKEEVTVLNSVN